MAVATLGAFVVVAGVLGIVSLYLGAVTQVLSGVQRTSPLPDYVGRPTPTAANPDSVRPMRYLVLVNDAYGYPGQRLPGPNSSRGIGTRCT